MSALGEKEKAEINYNKTKSLKEYTGAPGADMLIPPQIFLRDFMDLEEDTINEIKDYLGEGGFSEIPENGNIPDDTDIE
jgi:hypothetical protein